MKNYFSENLRYLRKTYNMTQVQLAKALGISNSAVSCYERGAREPAFREVATICKYFDITPDMLCYSDLELKVDQIVNFEQNQEFLDLFNQLTTEQQEAIITTMKAMVK